MSFIKKMEYKNYVIPGNYKQRNAFKKYKKLKIKSRIYKP